MSNDLSYSMDTSADQPDLSFFYALNSSENTDYQIPGSSNTNNETTPGNESSSKARTSDPPPAYQFQRSEEMATRHRGSTNITIEDSIDGSTINPNDQSVDYSSYTGFNDDVSNYNQYSEMSGDHNLRNGASVGGGGDVMYHHQHHSQFGEHDATTTVHGMHRKLLYLLSHPELFHDALDWQDKIDMGLDPSVDGNDDKDGEEGKKKMKLGGNGIQSFNEEFDEEEKDASAADDTNGNGRREKQSKFPAQQKLIPPLPQQIFAQDAEVVLPQALTASQLFGIERVTGIELEAAAGIEGLSHLFLRWLGTCTCCHTSSCTVIALTLRTFHYNSILQHNSTHARRRSHEHH